MKGESYETIETIKRLDSVRPFPLLRGYGESQISRDNPGDYSGTGCPAPLPSPNRKGTETFSFVPPYPPGCLGSGPGRDRLRRGSQKQNTFNLCKRSRYYQGLIDSKLLEPGQVDFNALGDTYIIIIAPFDLFGEGRYQYTFEMRCKENPEISLEDGAVRIFLNTRGQNPQDVSPELVELLSFIEHTNQTPADGYDSPKVRELQRQVSQIKSSEEIGVKFMQAWEERELDKKEAREEGRLLGQEEGKFLLLKNQIQKSSKRASPQRRLPRLWRKSSPPF